MTFRTKLHKLGALPAVSLALGLSLAPLAYAQTSPLLAHADSVSPANTSKTVEATVWLKMPNKSALDAAVSEMYQPGSATYHKWLTPAQLAKYEPTAAQAATVAKELSSKGLTVVSDNSQTMYVKVRGTVGVMQTAFNTRINEYTIKGNTVTAAASAPQVSGPAADLVANVGGLSGHTLQQYLRPAINPATRKPYAGVPVSKFAASPNGSFFASYCFFAQPEKKYFTTAGAKFPTATYYGNRYGANPTNTQLGNLAPCGYSPHDVRSGYNLNPAYKAGLNGAGQTIVIVDAYAASTIVADTNTFSKINSLPRLTSSNFKIYYPGGPVSDVGPQIETAIDVQWAHAIAPNAKIALLLAPSLNDSDLQSALLFAIGNGLGNVISNSYGGPESEDSPEDLKVWDAINELGAASGISVNFSSGDDGDFRFVTTDGKPTVSFPSDSPWATSIGGTTLALDGNQNLLFQTGWGNDYSEIYSGPSKAVLDPPAAFGFYAGGGGGQSAFFAKPSYQNNLPGKGRQQPDVSDLADPFTGGEIIVTINGQAQVLVYGGTSLACPIFSAEWAIANQKAGHALGQAAPIVSKLGGSNALFDITDFTKGYNPTGEVYDAKGVTHYTANALVQPLFNTTKYFSAFYPVSSGSWYVFSFGTDTSLTAGPGWDNVTGHGVPNGLNFINAAAKY